MPRTRRVAISIAANTFYGREAIHGILSYCMGHVAWDVHYEGGSSERTFARIASAISEWPAEGIIYQSLPDPVVELIIKRGIPAVCLRLGAPESICTVGPDNFAVGELVAKDFLQRRLVNLAFVGDEAFYSHRLAGFCAGLGARGSEVHELDLSGEEGKERSWAEEHAQITQWLRGLPKPVGIFACNDFIGTRIIRTCHNIGLRVPDEVSVIGVDNDTVECFLSPVPLSSVALPAVEIGVAAAKKLQLLMSGRDAGPNPTHLAPVGLVTRQSSDVFAVSDEDVAAALKFIRAHSCEPLSVSDVLRAVPISRRALERKCIALCGLTPRQQITRAHVDEAKRLLAETNLKMPAVSERAGFSRYQLFAPQFRSVTGMLPSEYRQRFSRQGVRSPDVNHPV